MTAVGAQAFLDHVERDEAFAELLKSAQGDPEATYRIVVDTGFDATPDEIKTAFLERYGSELTPEQLEAIAGGLDSTQIAIYSVAAVFVAAQVAAAIF